MRKLLFCISALVYLFPIYSISAIASLSCAPQSNAGTGATCSPGAGSVGVKGWVTLTTTATTPSSGAQAVITFENPYDVAPMCNLIALNANSISQMVLDQMTPSTSTTDLTINFGNADATGHSYVIGWHCF